MTHRPLSDEIIELNRDVWDAMQAHRFVADIEADRLDPEVFRRYFGYEGAFVETAITIFGYLLVKAPRFEHQQWMIGVLKALSEEQIGYFRDACRELGVPEPNATDPGLPMAVVNFQQGMLAIAAHGPFVDGIAAMFAAEWMYWTWCSRAAARSISQPAVRRWVDLHAAETFAAQARWLKQQVDREGETLGPDGRARVCAVFRRALLLEIDFHAAAYAA